MICPKCGAAVPANAPAGICPKCLMAAGLESGSQSRVATIDSPTANRFQPPEAAELAGKFPQLEVIELLGYGGMGAVYKARQARLDRFVALKILRPGPTNDAAFAERFSREAKTLARLNHPKIVSVYDFGEVDMQTEPDGQTHPLYYFVMEYVEGTNLRQLMQTGELKPDQAIAIVPEICEALQYAHDQGVVHRDIKPENILVDTRGHVKIADFGLAKLANRSEEDFTLTHAQQVMGTVRYMAPEQMEASGSVDHRADIYSLGVVFYEMLTGEVPAGNFDPPSRKVQLDVRLDEVVLRSLAREPDRRYQHASEVKTDVEMVSDSGQVGQSNGMSSPPATTSIDEQQRAAESAEVAPDWLCLPITALFIVGWSSVGLLWNFRLPGLVASISVMAVVVYLVLRMKLRYLPKLQRELEREPRWSRALAIINGLSLLIFGILMIISVQIQLLDTLFLTGVAGGANGFPRLLESETSKKAALELAASIGLQDVSLEFGGFGGSGAIYVRIVGFAVLSAWSIGGAVVSYFNARRYRYTWKYNFAPAITTTLWFFSTLYVVHFAHLMTVGFATAPMPAREIRIDADWDAIQPTLAEWQNERGYERAEYADFVLRDDEETVVGEFHQLRYEARSWFDAYQASWQYMLQRRRPPLVVSAASRKENPVTVLKVAFPHLRRYSPEKQIWTQLGDELEAELHALAGVHNVKPASAKPQLSETNQ